MSSGAKIGQRSEVSAAGPLAGIACWEWSLSCVISRCSSRIRGPRTRVNRLCYLAQRQIIVLSHGFLSRYIVCAGDVYRREHPHGRQFRDLGGQIGNNDFFGELENYLTLKIKILWWLTPLQRFWLQAWASFILNKDNIILFSF